MVVKPTLVLGRYTQCGPIEINVALEEKETPGEIEDVEVELQEV